MGKRRIVEFHLGDQACCEAPSEIPEPFRATDLVEVTGVGEHDLITGAGHRFEQRLKQIRDAPAWIRQSVPLLSGWISPRRVAHHASAGKNACR